MQTALRPWITTGIALVGASVIVAAPVAPPPPMEVPVAHVPSIHLPEVQLSASVLEIFTFPAFRQYVLNQITDYATWAAGLAQAGVNLGQVIGTIPETLVQLTQQLLSLDLLGALTTIETALVGALAAVGLPIIESIITVRERSLAVQLALQSAVPEAILGAGAAIFGAVDGVLRASIIGGQEVVDAVLTFNLDNIVDALVSATTGFLGSFVEGGQDIVDGIVFAQQLLAAALATPAPAAAAPELVMARSATLLPNLDDSGATMMLSTDSAVVEEDSTATGANESEPLGDTVTVTDEDEEAAAADEDEEDSTADEDEESPIQTDDETPVQDAGVEDTDTPDATETTTDTTDDAPSDSGDEDSAAPDGADNEGADSA